MADQNGGMSPGETEGGRRLPLHSPSDATYLSPLVCFIRSHLEVFSATQADVEARATYGRLVQTITVGRVGVRCVHCRDRPASDQAKGAVSYPASIRMLNQATRNWQRFHWASCKFIPPSAREEFDRLTSGKKPFSSRKSQGYWIRRSGEMGLVDTSRISRTVASSPDYTSADSGGTIAERVGEPEGIYFEEDARKLGLRILMPPEEKASGSTAKKTKTKKKAKGKKVGKKDTKKGVGATSEKHRSSESKNALDESQITLTSGDATNTSEGKMSNEIVPAEEDTFPTMDNFLSLDEFADDASLMSELGRMAEDYENGTIGSLDGTGFHHNTDCAHAPADDSNETGNPMQVDIDLASERDLQLLATLRATREMARAFRDKRNGVSATKRQTAADLRAFGEALYETLAGEDGSLAMPSIGQGIKLDEGNNDERSPKRERRREEDRPGHATTSLQDLGYPTSISIFVQSLIDATDEDSIERFISFADVDNDLRLMIEFPNKYLFDASPEASRGRLDFPSDIYGVQTQRAKLKNAFRSVVVTGEERHGLALIAGQSGSGKTSLVKTLVGPLGERRGRLIEIKFDKKDNQSTSTIFRAFDQYCRELQGDPDLFDVVGAALKTALGSFSEILLGLMPNLPALIGEASSTLPSIDNKEKYNLLFNCLQIFVRAIAAPTHPIVILFDDLQWANSEALGLMTKFIKDPETRSCLFVGCYRDNEVLIDHPLLEYMGEVLFAGVPMWQIFQESIGKGSTNELLSDTLHLLPRITAPLAREVHKKTGGNPHFAKQLLQSLYDERLLQFSPSARRWRWDISAIRSKNIPDNAVDLLLERMTHYGSDVQRVLQVAALMGRRFDASALQMFQAGGDADGDGSAILAHINTIVDDGLVCIDNAELRFAHDSIWEAALSLTPVTERESMHLLIGRQLLQAASGPFCPSLDLHMQLIVDQMNRGSSLIEGHDEKSRLAELNLQVGQRALASSSFLEASLYLLQGSALLSYEDWNGNYRLCLAIFTACAEAQLAYGNYDGAIISANAVIVHGRSSKDKLRAQYTTYIALYIQGRAEEACPKALSVLEELGVDLPSIEASIPPETIRSEVERTEHLLSSTNSQQIVTRALSEDSSDTVAFTMRFLASLSIIVYVSKPTLFSLVGCRMVQIVMEQAMTSEASIAFATYSNILCTLGLRDRSAACAQIAMALQDRFHGEHSQTAILACNISIHPYRLPWRACLDLCERASHVAMAVGDVNCALIHQGMSAPMYIFAPLSTLQEAREKLTECHRSIGSPGHPQKVQPIICLQILLNLTTSCAAHNGTDPTILKGDATNQKDILSMLPPSKMYYDRLVRRVDFARLYLGCLFRHHDVILEMALKVKEHLAGSKFYSALELLLEKFYLGLAAYSIIRRCDVGDTIVLWQAVGDELTNDMRELSKNDSKWNFQQKYLLLEAEKAFTDGNVEVAAASYDKAIEAAKEHRFINEQALASECAALFYLDQENIGQARSYLVQARDLYVAWGAHRKRDDVEDLLAATCG